MPFNLVLLLLSASIRACGLGVVAFVGVFVFRIRSSAARHATWTIVLVGMLVQIPLGVLAPTIRVKALPNLPAPIQPRVMESPQISAARAPSPAPLSHAHTEPKSRRVSFKGTITAVYLVISMLLFVQMAFASGRLRRILRDAKPVPILGPGVFESGLFVVPGSVGCFRARVVLPRAWRDWDAGKIRAVLAHERAHICRRDLLIHVASHFNVCIFWFHPLAWWLERELARLAEEACDDIALCQTGDRYEYAATLVGIAHAAAANRGVLNWRVSSMAKDSNVMRRVNRILDGRLQIPKPFGRLAWVALFAFGLPVIYLSSSVELASANRDTRILDRSVVRPADEARVIADIIVQGYRRIPREIILAHVLTRVGDIFDQASIERDMNSLWNTGFSKMSASSGRRQLRVGLFTFT